MRFVSSILRLLGLVLLASGTVLAVGDIARSLAAEQVALMSIGEARALAMPEENPAAQVGVSNAAAAGVFATDGRGARFSSVVDQQPASVVLGLGGIVLLVLGRRPRPAGRTLGPR